MENSIACRNNHITLPLVSIGSSSDANDGSTEKLMNKPIVIEKLYANRVCEEKLTQFTFAQAVSHCA